MTVGGPESAAKATSLAHRLKRLLGLDGAIAYTVLARVCGIVGSAGTVLLIVHFMSRVEQGYYYVLLSLISLRLVFELGATLVIIQMAAHECVHLTFGPAGTIEGSSVALDRLASLLQKTVRWYSAATVLMAMTLLPVGWLFLSSRSAHAGVHWQWPWVLAVLATACLLALDSVIFFLEGCGQIRQVAKMRAGQAVAGAVLAWTFLALRHGLFAPGMVSVAYGSVGAIFLFRRRKLLMSLFCRPVASDISWRMDVWPFQWRLGASAICAYFTAQVFAPIAFATLGPVEAGQIGMSMSIVGYLSILVLAWMSTKAPVFGALVAQKDFKQLDRLFFGTLRRSLPILTGLAVICEGLLVALHYGAPGIADRMVSPGVFAVLLIAAIGSHLIQSLGLYLRAFKREPFLMQSIVVSGITVALCLVLAKTWGNAGIAFSYVLSVGVIGSAWAVFIFQNWRKGTVQTISPQSLAPSKAS